MPWRLANIFRLLFFVLQDDGIMKSADGLLFSSGSVGLMGPLDFLLLLYVLGSMRR
jgi:hypothetical protein